MSLRTFAAMSIASTFQPITSLPLYSAVQLLDGYGRLPGNC